MKPIFRHIVLFSLAIALACGGCKKGHNAPRLTPEEALQKSPFHIEKCLKYTPIKDQGRSTLCWIYAMLATIETDRLMEGDSVDLSADYLARHYLQDQLPALYLQGPAGGDKEAAQQVDTRGMMTMALRLMEQHGMEPHASFHAKKGTDYGVIGRRLMQLVTTARAQQWGLSKLTKQAEELLDEEIDFMPRFVFMLGAEYTPQEFAHSLCMPGDYEALTSFTHHPFGERFALEVTDNKMDCEFLNVPIDTLMYRIRQSITNGHAVCWEGDVSEVGFSFERGMAGTASPIPCTQQERQREFERLKTTDDHCMALIGIATDQRGARWYIAKNSWGTNNLYGGLMFLSENYLRLKTIAVAMKNDSN